MKESLRKEQPQARVKRPSPHLQRAYDKARKLAADWTPTPAQALQRTYGNQALQRRAVVQTKMSVGPANDIHEQEADRVAAQVVQRSQPTGAPAELQRKEAGGGMAGGEVSPQFEQELRAAKGGGAPLGKDVLGQMNTGFGADFSQVRVHADSRSDALNQSINARAFTSGSDIFFRPQEYHPESSAGKQILAHELTHVVQQGGAAQGVQRKSDASAIQRLISASAFRKDTKLAFGRKGKSGDVIAGIVQALQIYEGPLKSALPGVKIKHLSALIQTIQQWLATRDANKTSRRGDVVSLRDDLRNEITTIKQSLAQVSKGDFDDANLVAQKDAAYGAQMNTLDELVYNFSVDGDIGGETMAPGGTFTAVFKENLSVDPLFGKHRGAGIPQQNPEFAKRNLAMQEIDKLLGANVIPKTFLAKHNNKEGFIMEKVNGLTGSQIGKAPERDDGTSLQDEIFANPKVRQSLSNLYLLDMICAQVDRHPGNFMVVIENGVIKGVKGIDNDLAFGKDVDLEGAMKFKAGSWARGAGSAGKLVDELKEIDRTMAQKIIDLDSKHALVRNALAGLLTKQEIDATLKRLTHLADFLLPLMSKSDGVIKSKWE